MKILSEEEYRIHRFKELPWDVIGYKEINFAKDYIFQLEKENKELKEKEELHLNRIDELTDRVVDLKSVIKEVKEITKTAVPKNNGDYMMIHFDNWRKLEERLDKVKENK